MLQARTTVDLHRAAHAHWPLEPTLAACGLPDLPPGLGDVELMSLLDQLEYLPDDVLAKVDRATMAVGLEARAPLLDHALVEFALRTPMHRKIRHGQGKWLLRQLLYRHVPRRLVERPKHGFGAPIATWLRGPLRAWAEDLLDPTDLAGLGELDPARVRQCWSDHLAGRRDAHVPLWNVLMLQAWWRERAASAAAAATAAAAASVTPAAAAAAAV
jgi:asparagine synthase (glutamine-hydrolysing)